MVYSRSAHLCIATIVVCLLNFLGWVLDISLLKAPIPGTPAMSFATAILFFINAFGLFILYSSDGYKKANILLARLLVLTSVAISVFLLARYLRGTQGTLANGLTPPSPQTLLFTMSLGFYLFFISLESKKFFWLVNVLQLVSFSVLRVVLFGYLVAINQFVTYASDGSIGMGVFTLICGSMLWISSARLRPELDVVIRIFTQRGAGGKITRTLFLISLLVPLLMGMILHALNPGSAESDLMFQVGIMLAAMGVIMCLLSTLVGMQLMKIEINSQDSLLQEVLNASNLECQLRQFKSLQAVPMEVCSWSRRIKINGSWESFEDFLNEHFHIQISQSISEEEMEKVLDDFAGKNKELVGWSI